MGYLSLLRRLRATVASLGEASEAEICWPILDLLARFTPLSASLSLSMIFPTITEGLSCCRPDSKKKNEVFVIPSDWIIEIPFARWYDRSRNPKHSGFHVEVVSVLLTRTTLTNNSYIFNKMEKTVNPQKI